MTIKCDDQPFFLPTFQKLILFRPRLEFSRSASLSSISWDRPRLGLPLPLRTLRAPYLGCTRLPPPPGDCGHPQASLMAFAACALCGLCPLKLPCARELQPSCGGGCQAPLRRGPALPSLGDCCVPYT